MTDPSSSSTPLVKQEQAKTARPYQKHLAIVQRVGIVVGGLPVGLWIGFQRAAVTSFLDGHGGAIGAIAAVAVAAFTYTLWRSTDRLQVVTAESLKQLQRDYLAANRPQLVLRQIGFEPDENSPRVRYTLGNVGNSTATVLESNITVWLPIRGEEWPALPPYGPERNAMGHITVEAAQEIHGAHQDTPEDLDLLVGEVSHDQLDTMLLGYVVYVDDNGGKRRFGFCRKRATNGTRFIAVDDPDYEFYY